MKKLSMKPKPLMLTLKDCDCEYCLYYGGNRNGEVICLTSDCPCRDVLREIFQRERKQDGSQNQ